VIEAKDGSSAVDAANKHTGTIDLVVTDAVMPGMGDGQLAEIPAEKYPNIRVLVMSGYAETIVHSYKIMDLEVRSDFCKNRSICEPWNGRCGNCSRNPQSPPAHPRTQFHLVDGLFLRPV